MGNTQCGQPATNVNDDAETYTGPTADSNEYGFEVPDLQSNFLVLHLQERADKCIIDPKLLVQALVSQAEELIRRELEDELPRPRSQSQTFAEDTFSSAASEIYAKTDLTGYLSSVAPSTTITSSSAKTRVVANRNRYSRRKTRLGETMNPPRLLGDRVDLNDTLYVDLYYVIEAITKEEEKKRYANAFTPKPSVGCSVIPSSITLPSSEPTESYQAKMHMIVVHLRMAPRCAEFYQSHLSRYFPNNPFTKAVSSGISSSDLAPSQSFRRNGILPDLLWNDSDSTSSKSNDMDFGAGPPSVPIQLLVNDQPFMDLGITGSLGMIERQKRDMKAMEGRKFLRPPEHYLCLVNRRSGTPLAICALKKGESGENVRIFATKHRVYGQRPAATTRKLGLDWTQPLPLFAWAEIVTKGRYPNKVQYSIFMATGNDGRFEENPSYVAEHSSIGSPEIRVLGMTNRETEYTGCAVLCLSRDEEASEDELYFRLSISKGVDPALLICFAAFVDESMERVMRIQCSSVSESVYRVSSV